MGEGKDKHASHTSKNGTALVNKEESLKFNLASLKRIDKDVEEVSIGHSSKVDKQASDLIFMGYLDHRYSKSRVSVSISTGLQVMGTFESVPSRFYSY